MWDEWDGIWLTSSLQAMLGTVLEGNLENGAFEGFDSSSTEHGYTVGSVDSIATRGYACSCGENEGHFQSEHLSWLMFASAHLRCCFVFCGGWLP